MWWPFKTKKKEDVKKQDEVKGVEEKTVFTWEDVVAEAERMESPILGAYTYHPHIWANFILQADKIIKNIEEENKDLKQRLTEYKQELASYHL